MADNNAFIGYRSAGRRPESQQDRRAAADAPLSALRGMVSGVLGAPGDIESLVRMLPGLSERTVLPTSEDVERRLPMPELNQTPTGRAFTTAGQLGGGFYTGPGSPLRAIAALPSAVSRAGRDFAMAAGQPAVNVVKPKGGNWLAGSVERSIEPMIPRTGAGNRVARDTLEEMNRTYPPNVVDAMSPETRASIDRAYEWLNPNVAMQDWLEKKLSKYIKNEMATPEDPLRALAERGVLHVDPEQLNFRPELHGRFMSEGQTAVAQSPAAKSWEGASDLTVGQMPAGQLLQQGYAEQMPWLAKVPPETPVYMPSQSGMADDLGFGHLVDELRNAVNPESGLPANLRLKYQDLEKVTVPQAVERVAKINEWRAAQKAEADMARAMGPATQVVKEYPEQGFKWVELRQPKETGKKVSREKTTSELEMADEGVETMSYEDIVDMVNDLARDEGIRPGTREFNEMLEDNIRMFGKKPDEVDESYKALEDALKYEGETMGHCVGGYCPDVVEGRSKIYSLRDKKGQPHVTIEVQPGRKLTEKDMPDDVRDMLSEQYGDASREEFEAAVQQYLQSRSVPDAIVQIKGKANRAPNAEYLPAVQDFVRSGNFGKIGDLQNAGLVDVQDPNALLRALGKVSPERNIDQAIDNFNTAIDSAPNAQRYMTLDELRDFLGGSAGPEGFSQGGQVRGYAEGGQVSGANFPTGDFDPARIDTIVGELHALNAG